MTLKWPRGVYAVVTPWTIRSTSPNISRPESSLATRSSDAGSDDIDGGISSRLFLGVERPRRKRAVVQHWPGPDLFIISPGDFLRYYNGGVLLDLTPFMEETKPRRISSEGIGNRKVDDKIYGLPFEVEPMAMYYSVDAFNEAGLNENDVPKTWDQLIEVAKKLTN